MTNMKTPADDGLDPEKLKKRIESEGELAADEELDRTLAVTGEPPKANGPVNSPD